MKRVGDKLAQVEVTSREALRRWLARNHAQSAGIWLVTYKKQAGARHLPYDDIVEEALAFGWIDSLPRELDAQRSMRLLAPRKAGSAWSQVNKARVERLVAQGLMTEAGMAKVAAARADGSWSKLDAVEALTIDADLAEALHAWPQARANFDAFPRSSKRLILEWIAQARQPETRARRIAETAELASRNIRAHHARQPKGGG